VEEVAEWLQSRGLEAVASAFRKQKITGNLLPSISNGLLVDMGLNAMGDRMNVLAVLRTLVSDKEESQRASQLTDSSNSNPGDGDGAAGLPPRPPVPDECPPPPPGGLGWESDAPVAIPYNDVAVDTVTERNGGAHSVNLHEVFPNLIDSEHEDEVDDAVGPLLHCQVQPNHANDDEACSMHDDDARSMVSEGGSDVFLKCVYETQQINALFDKVRLHMAWVKDCSIADKWYSNYGSDKLRYRSQRSSALQAGYRGLRLLILNTAKQGLERRGWRIYRSGGRRSTKCTFADIGKPTLVHEVMIVILLMEGMSYALHQVCVVPFVETTSPQTKVPTQGHLAWEAGFATSVEWCSENIQAPSNRFVVALSMVSSVVTATVRTSTLRPQAGSPSNPDRGFDLLA